jgi:CheY-like chemotaxis protein
MDDRGVSEPEQHGSDRCDQRRVVAARQVCPPDRPRKQCIAYEEVGTVRTWNPRRDREAYAAGAMPRRVVRPRVEIAKREHVRRAIELVDRRRGRVHTEPEHGAVLDGAFVEKQVVAVKVDGNPEGSLRAVDTGDMVDVRMGQQDPVEPDPPRFGKREEGVHLVSGVDQHPFAGSRTCHDESVLEERTNRGALDYDHGVILAILDDLMFTSKIKTTARQLGVAVSIARSRDGALADMRAQHPALVILDLNNPRTDPLGTVAEMKADPALASIATVGFSHHAQTDTIAAARQAGVGEVLARGAFFERLPDLLMRLSSSLSSE